MEILLGSWNILSELSFILRICRFFQRTGLVVGVFSALGITVIGFLSVVFILIRWHRRAKQAERDLTEAHATIELARSRNQGIETDEGMNFLIKGEIHHGTHSEDTKPLLASPSVSEMEGNRGLNRLTNTGTLDSIFSAHPPSTYPGSILPTYHDVIESQSLPPAYYDLSLEPRH